MSVYSYFYMAQKGLMPSCTRLIMPNEIHPSFGKTDFLLLRHIISSLGKKSLINDNIAAPSAQLCVRMNHLLHRVNAILAFWYSSSRRWFSSKQAFYSSSLGRWFYSKQLAIIGNVLQFYHSEILLLFSESLFKSTLWRLPREGKAINWEFYYHTSVKWCTPVETIL